MKKNLTVVEMGEERQSYFGNYTYIPTILEDDRGEKYRLWHRGVPTIKVGDQVRAIVLDENRIQYDSVERLDINAMLESCIYVEE